VCLRPEGPIPSAQVEDLGAGYKEGPALKGPFTPERPLQGRGSWGLVTQVFDLG